MSMHITAGVAATEWFAVQVWAGREQFSASQLRLRGCEVLLPSYRERRRWSDRVKAIERALFSGYVFCHMQADSVWKLTRAPGVIRVVGDGQRPLPVPEHDMATIQRLVDAQASAQPCDYLQVGQHVRIEVGPLRGATGRVLTVKNQQRLIVSIPMLQRSVAVEVEASWLSTATPYPLEAAGERRALNAGGGR
jgi:transcription antitermination factor NusG